jgi:hypothetical protein
VAIAVPHLKPIVAPPRWAKDGLWRKAQLVPSLDLNFAATKNLVDATTGAELVTFTRTSDGTATNSSGNLIVVPANMPRFDHDPMTGESLGLLVEEQRSNGIRNNTMVGAVAGTPGTLPTNWGISGLGTLTQQIIGIGSINGIAYIDVRVSGTSSTSQFTIRLDSATAISATNGQTWTVSSWLAVVGGSLTNIGAGGLGWLIYDSGAGFLGGSPGSVPLNNTSTLMRLSYTGQITTANTAFIQPQIFFLCSSGAAIDITLRIGLPQLEQGAFTTSVIPTSGAAATRAADVCSISGSNFSSWYRQDEGTFYTQQRTDATDSIQGAYMVQAGTQQGRGIAASIDTRDVEQRLATSIRDDVSFGRASIAGLVDNDLQSIGHSWSDGATTAALNGITGTGTYNAIYPGLDTLHIGYNVISAGSPTYLGGRIKRLTFWPQRFDASVLQAITQ